MTGGLHPLFSIWGALRTQCFKAVCQNSLLGDATKPCVSYAVCLAALPRWHQPRVGPVTPGVGVSGGNQATLPRFCLTRLHIRNFLSPPVLRETLASWHMKNLVLQQGCFCLFVCLLLLWGYHGCCSWFHREKYAAKQKARCEGVGDA